MPSRKIKFVVGENYHIFNRGVDKRSVFEDYGDIKRFFKSVTEFNSRDVVGGIFRSSLPKNKEGASVNKLVKIRSYCFNPNHFHFILEPVTTGGIEKFMQRLGNGYTKFFNEKYSRSGSLFQGPFKATYIENNDLLLYLSAYVNLNYKVHQLRHPMSQLVRSSWKEYLGDVSKDEEICEKDIVLGQFRNRKEYKMFAEDTVKEIVKRRKEDEDLDKLLID